MFETEFTGVMDESPTSEDQVINTETTDEVVESALDNQSDGLTDIQDSTNESKTIPYDRFEDVNTRYKDQLEINKKLIQLLENSNKTQTPVQQDQDSDIIDKIVGEDMFVTKDQMREILKYQKQHTDQVLQSTSQSSKEQALTQHEASFRQSAPDYDEVIKNIPVKVIQSLYETYDNPQDLVSAAYNIGKSFVPATPSTTVKSVIPPAPKAKPPVTLNQVKGGSIGKVEEPTSAEDIFRSRFG